MRQPTKRSGRLRAASRLLLGAALVTLGCGANQGGGVNVGKGDGGMDPDLSIHVIGNDGGLLRPDTDLLFDSDAFWADDPPLMFCALDGGSFPPQVVPGGTPECPDDKNREGC